MDAFISHSSDDIESVRPIELELEKRGLSVWLDDSDLRQGVALAGKLQESIRDSRSVVLVWSKAARGSRWVNAEWLMAIHIGRPIIAVAIDPTKVPQCLENTTYLRVKEVTPDAIDRIERDIREAPDEPDPLSPMQAAQGPELYAAIGKIAVAQQKILDLLGEWKVDQAAKRQAALDPIVWRARRRWR